jgi:hypothetical protein
MKVTSGKIGGGILDENEETFEVTPEEEAALLRAIAEADRGDVISAEQVLEDLRSLR